MALRVSLCCRGVWGFPGGCRGRPIHFDGNVQTLCGWQLVGVAILGTGTCKLYVAGSLSGWLSWGRERANSMKLSQRRGGHPGDGNVQTLCGWQLVGVVLQGMGICKQTFQKNVGAPKVAVLLVDFFMDWTCFWLSCVNRFGGPLWPISTAYRPDLKTTGTN